MYSYGEKNTLSLTNPISQLIAPNGNGKSNIALIIQELLYSKNIKGIKKGDIKNRYNNSTEWQGGINFEANNIEYELSVTRKGTSSKVILLADGRDISQHKIPDTYKLIRNILGMDFEVFSQLTYQSSIDLLEFIKTTDTNRKKFLIKLFNLEKYIDIGETLKLKLSIAEKEATMLQGELNGIEKFLEETVIEDKLEKIEVLSLDEYLINKEKKLSLQISNHENKSKQIDKNNLYIKELASLVFDITLIEPSKVRYEEIIDICIDNVKNINNYEKDYSNYEHQIKRLDTAATCYACGQEIDNRKAIELKDNLISLSNIIELELNILNTKNNKLLAENLKLEENFKKFKINQKIIERFEQLSQLINKELPIKHEDINNLYADLEDITVELACMYETINNANSHNNNINTHNTKVDTLTQQKREFLARQQLLNNDIIVIKNKVKNLNILKKAFSTSGLVAFKLENLTKELEDTINKYLSELSDGKFQVIFRLTGEKLNVIVRSNGLEAPIETVSGGEFGRIQTAILLAIRSILVKIGGNNINLLFLDEIDGVLDSDGKEKLIEVLQEEKDLNVFLISHSFNHPLLEKINIIKENNISRIE